MSGVSRVGLLALVLCCLPVLAQEIQFPELSGRVVDKAGMIDAATEERLVNLFKAHEGASGNQLVVVTLKDLQGYTIEQFGYRLGREWGIGQQGQNNGALLLVAEAERKVRIEVGYGLEGQLTDALSSDIVHNVILPEFKRGRFSEGISKGAQAMVQALDGEYQPSAGATPTDKRTKALVLLLVFGGWLALAFITSVGGTGMGSRRPFLLGGLGGGRSGGFGGGGFSGGGGSFGGGGASGGW